MGINKADDFVALVREQVQSDIIAMSENAIQEAIKSFETELRKRVAALAITHAEKHYQVHRDMANIVISISL